jgi:hypothetical protein
LWLAEADGNRTRLVELLDHVGVEDRGDHQAPIRLRGKTLVPAPAASTPRQATTRWLVVSDRVVGWVVELVMVRQETQLTPSFSAAILVPSTRFLIFWNATSRA